MCMKKNEMFTITEAAVKLGVTRQAVGYMVKNKLIETVKGCSKKLITADAINEYLRKKG